MKFLYQLIEDAEKELVYPFSLLGIRQCIFEKMHLGDDKRYITDKRHSHNFFEVHIIKKGYQIYETEEITYYVPEGNILIIPPVKSHKIIENACETEKYSITFSSEKNEFFEEIFNNHKCLIGSMTQEMLENIKHIEKIKNKGSLFLNEIVANRIFELIVSMFSLFNIKGEKSSRENIMGDPRIMLVKKFIEDNITLQLTVSDISAYCHLSNKQLTRLFKQTENSTPSVYIQKKRCEYIEKLLIDESYSIKEISELMNFNNEFYFNAFFKKHFGIPPHTFRRMNKNINAN